MTVEVGPRRAGLSRERSSHRPLYARALNLRNLQPGGLLCFLFFEGALAAGILLALAEVIEWWGILALPAFVAAMVKVNDVSAGPPDTGALPAGERVRREQERCRRLTAVGRACVTPPPAPPHRRAEEAGPGMVTPSSLAHARAATTSARYDSPPSAHRYGNSATSSATRFGSPLGNDPPESSHWRTSRAGWPLGDTWAGAPAHDAAADAAHRGWYDEAAGPAGDTAYDAYDVRRGAGNEAAHGAGFDTSYDLVRDSWSPADRADHTPWPELAAPTGEGQPVEPIEPAWESWPEFPFTGEPPGGGAGGGWSDEAGAHAAPDPWPALSTERWTPGMELPAAEPEPEPYAATYPRDVAAPWATNSAPIGGRHGAPEAPYDVEPVPPAPLGFTTVEAPAEAPPPVDPLRQFAASVRAAVEGHTSSIVARKTNGKHAQQNGAPRSRQSANYRYPRT